MQKSELRHNYFKLAIITVQGHEQKYVHNEQTGNY